MTSATVDLCNVYCCCTFSVILNHNAFEQVVKKWLYFLPLKHDFKEAIYAHGLLSKLIQRCCSILNSSFDHFQNIITFILWYMYWSKQML